MSNRRRADRPELDRLSRERPQERDRIAAPVPDPEQPQRPGDESERHQRPDARGDRCRQYRERNDDERQKRRVDVAEVVPDRVDVLVGRPPVEHRVTCVEEDSQVRGYHPARESPERRVVVQMRADLRRQDDRDGTGRARERDQCDSAGPTLHARTLAAVEDASPMRHAGRVPWISCEHLFWFSLRASSSLRRRRPTPPLQARRFGSPTGKTPRTPRRA